MIISEKCYNFTVSLWGPFLRSFWITNQVGSTSVYFLKVIYNLNTWFPSYIYRVFSRKQNKRDSGFDVYGRFRLRWYHWNVNRVVLTPPPLKVPYKSLHFKNKYISFEIEIDLFFFVQKLKTYLELIKLVSSSMARLVLTLYNFLAKFRYTSNGRIGSIFSLVKWSKTE